MKKYSKYLVLGLVIIAFLISICFVPIRVSKLIPIIEEQVEKDLGVKIHIERLVLRLGPDLKVKAPIMHLMYEDGQKFAQFDNVKFYISWASLLKDSPKIKMVDAKKLNIRIYSDDKYFEKLLETLNNKKFEDLPNIKLKEYLVSYVNKESNYKYQLDGQQLLLNKINTVKNFKIKTNGSFGINSQKYISYDIALEPNIELSDCKFKGNIEEILEQVLDLDFHSDVIADVKVYRASNKQIQASGFINVDNISVLDKAKKNPKSFIYLTLWGDKASVLSNIYTAPNKKVYVEGMVNNSKKPIIDLKVKTDEISISDLYQKLKIFTDISHIKNINSIDGTLNANFTLKGDLNKIKSAGFLKISNASINAKGLKVEKINSEIDFSNNIINIVNTIGYVNSAPIIAKGSISKNIDIELLMSKVELKHLCPSNLGIKSGIVSLIAHLTGNLDNISHKENLLLENLKVDNKDFNLSLDNLKYDTNKNNTAYLTNLVLDTNKTETIKVPSVKLLITPDCIKIPDTNIFMPNSKLIAKVEVLDYANNNLTFNSTLNGFVNSKDIKQFSTNSTRYPVKININGNKIAQNINAQLFLEKTDILDEPAVLNLASKLEKNSLKIDDLSLVGFSGKFSDDFKLNVKGNKKVVITGAIDDIAKPIFKNLRIFIPQQLNLNLYDTLAVIKGDLFINGSILTPEIVGQLLVQNLFNQQMQLALSNSTFDFNKNNIVINAPFAKLADTSIGINALISTNLTKELLIKTINIKSKYLSTDTILMYKDSPIMNIYPIRIQEGKFYSERILANVYGSPIYLMGFSSDFSLENEVLRLKNITSELFNGKMTGNLAYDLHDEHFDSQIMARGVSAEPIFSVVSTRKDSISGIMDFDLELKGELTSKESLNGKARFVVNNGRMSSLGKLEHLLYAQNVVADNMLRTSLSVVTKAITLKDTGLFKYLRGDVDLENGVAKIKMLQSQGPLMSLFIKGIYNPINNYANMLVLGRLSDEVVSGLGTFGDFSFNKLLIMLTGEEQKQAVLPEDYDKIPQLPMKNTKEFRSIINGNIDKPSSVLQFNWISYSQKSLKQKEIPMTEVKLPDFVESLPY